MIAGTFSDPREVNARIELAAESYHLISPITSVESLETGVAVAFSVVTIDPKRDTFPTERDEVGLAKVALNRLALALGISWDPRLSHRADTATHPHYCAWDAVGAYRALDGQLQQIVGSSEIDLRAGMPRALELSGAELDRARKFLVATTETAAQLRAVRSLGIRGSYTKEELTRPFCAVRVLFAGRSTDAFAESSHALYGSDPGAARRAPPAVPGSDRDLATATIEQLSQWKAELEHQLGPSQDPGIAGQLGAIEDEFARRAEREQQNQENY